MASSALKFESFPPRTLSRLRLKAAFNLATTHGAPLIKDGRPCYFFFFFLSFDSKHSAHLFHFSAKNCEKGKVV